MSRLKSLLIAKLDNDGLLSLINRGFHGTQKDTIQLICDLLADRPNSETLIKSMAAGHNKITIQRLYKNFNSELWVYYIKYHIYYIMPEHVRYMPEKAQELYKESHEHTFYAIMNNGSDKDIETARYVDYLLSVSTKG